MSDAERTRTKEKLREQLGFLSRSCAHFDAGHESEALRLATGLRILFHNTRHSRSLLVQLGLENGEMLSSSRGHGNWKDYFAERIDINSPQPVSMRPLLGDKFVRLPVSDWWSSESVFVHEGDSYSRRKIILSAANKDGGAHVDPQLEAYYQILCEGRYASGITGNLEYSGEPPFPQGVTIYPSNAHLALIRQFAHEAIVSIGYFAW